MRVSDRMASSSPHFVGSGSSTRMRSNGVSLMPVGLEKQITIEQMADLIAFIKNWRYLDGSVPVGK